MIMEWLWNGYKMIKTDYGMIMEWVWNEYGMIVQWLWNDTFRNQGKTQTLDLEEKNPYIPAAVLKSKKINFQ